MRIENSRGDRGDRGGRPGSLVSWPGREGVEGEGTPVAGGRRNGGIEEEWKSTVGRGGDRRNTYPVSFTLWLQLIRNRLSFERFSIDRLRSVVRKEGRTATLRAVPRATERTRKGKREIG